MNAASAATFVSLGNLLSSHRGTTRVALAALSFALIVAFSTQAPVTTQAGPEPAPLKPESLLPQNVGVGVPTGDAVTITFDAAMNPGTVEADLQVLPDQSVDLVWSQDLDQLTLAPERQWRADETYVVVIGGAAMRTDGQSLPGAMRFSFTTQTAPSVTDFQVRLADIETAAAKPDPELDARAEALLEADALAPEAPGSLPPTLTAKAVSATSAITVTFSDEMDQADVEDRFAITPEVPGDLTWEGGELVFTPTERLTPGARYTISVIGSHDAAGNPLGGKGNFSFIVNSGAQVTQTLPAADATDVEPGTVEIWFSQPMDEDATNAAFGLRDTATGALVGGNLTWNEARTQLVYVPDVAFAGGSTFAVTFEGGARDTDGNVIDTSLAFSTKAAPAPVIQVVEPVRGATTTRSVVVPPAGPATSLAGYALNQVNAARAAYGFAPVVLDAGISAAASAHAWDQANNDYFSHYGLNGSSRDTRLRAAGVNFTYSSENQCYYLGMSEQATLDWCHTQFMAEPYPGYWNHISNILDPRATRMGVGIATANGRTVITWNFTN